ncbi:MULTISPECIES: hypothetical protein [Trichocoleus]|uniref:Uncharacterized protein n=1 Tax=Trichocoleus desertorum GB2-A4 TaxID=2933944 RepID=A0ABV0JH42_9CYAN|nr:hypothetical protein [Trichocoleus sp. FACHB-46]MBD1862328.1 hypothetical protein [Trichocoleus sp. FACHB-46]
MVNSTFKFAAQSPEELAAIVGRFQNQIPTWQDYLFFLGMLPEFTRLKWSFEPGTEDEVDEFGRLFWLQSALAEWVDYLVTKSQSPDSEGVPVPSDLRNSEKVVVKVRAELSKAVLDLARFTFDRVSHLKTANRPTPESVWFAWEVQSFEDMVLHSGLITGQATKRESKETVNARCQEIAKILEAANPRTLLLSTAKVDYADELLGDLEALLCFAYAEAVSDIYFRNSREYIGFQRALRAWSRECRSHSFWILPQFENGKRLPTGRKAKRDPKQVNSQNVRTYARAI